MVLDILAVLANRLLLPSSLGDTLMQFESGCLFIVDMHTQSIFRLHAEISHKIADED